MDVALVGQAALLRLRLHGGEQVARQTYVHGLVRAAAAAVIRAMWREVRADWLEAVVLGDLFGADAIPDAAEREAAKDRAFEALATLLRYRGRIEREHRQAMAALESLRQRRLATPPAVLPSEHEPALPKAAAAVVARPDEPEPRSLNHHQRRAWRR
jgi:hypothetical protein